jgi:hypothetical protein
MSWGCIEQLFIVMVAKILCAQKKRNNNHAPIHATQSIADLCTKNSVRTEKVVHKQPRTKQSIMQKFCHDRKNA